MEAVVSADALKEPKWRSLDYLISDTKSLFELGIIGVAQDVLQAQSAMLDILRWVIKLASVKHRDCSKHLLERRRMLHIFVQTSRSGTSV